MLALILASAFLAGCLIADFGLWLESLLVWALVGTAAILTRNSLRELTLLLIIPLVAALGGLRATTVALEPVPDELRAQTSFEVTVVDVPRRFSTHTLARLRPTDSNIVLTATMPSLARVQQGDVLLVTGSVEPVTRADSGGRLFVYQVDHVRQDASRPERLRNWLAERTEQVVGRHLPEPAASLALGVMTGDDGNLTEPTRERFRRAGLSHITAVSGWNVAIVAGLVAVLARASRQRRGVVLTATLLAVWSYAFLVGMVPSVSRAAAMASILLLANFRGRPYDMLTSLLVSAALLVAHNPLLRHDVGFQLSFAAVLGLALALPWLKRLDRWQAALIVPLVAELAVTPLLLHHFGSYSLVGPLINAIVAPLIPILMAGGLIVVAGGALHPIAGEIAGVPAWVAATVMVWLVDQSAGLDWAAGETQAMGSRWVLVSYLGLGSAWLLLTLWQQLWNPGWVIAETAAPD